MVNNYRRGANYEYRKKKLLEKQGYYVIRSAGSHGMIDLVAFNPETKDCMLIQCKAYKMSQNRKDAILEPLEALQGTYTVRAVLM